VKLFLDTANSELIKKGLVYRTIDGVTTNPSIIAKEGAGFEKRVREIVQLMAPRPVSVEAMSEGESELVAEAKGLSTWGENVVVKMPLTPAGVAATYALSEGGIKTNVTMVASANQVLLAAKAGATYISIIIGRIDAMGFPGAEVVRDAVAILRNYGFGSKLILGSMRHPIHVLEAAKGGVDVVTVSFALLDSLYQHPLTREGLAQFKKDWATVPP